MHCPICGKPLFEGDDGQWGDVSPCEHLAFIFIGEVSEYVYTSEDFDKRTESVDKDNFDEFRDFLGASEYDNKLLALEINCGGMACGPVWSSDVYGFDFGTLKNFV